MPRTTVDIDASGLRELKKRQEKDRKTLGQLISELLAQAMEAEKERTAATPVSWVTQDLKPRVDLEGQSRGRVDARRAMSRTVDTSVLVYATHRASPFHHRARALVEHLVTVPGLAYILWPAVLGSLRIVTHPNILRRPLSSDAAMSNIQALVAPSHVRVSGEGYDFWAAFRSVAADVAPRGDLVSEAHLVALMREHGVSTIWSHDRDFRKFRSITVRDPFSEEHSTGFD